MTNGIYNFTNTPVTTSVNSLVFNALGTALIGTYMNGIVLNLGNVAGDTLSMAVSSGSVAPTIVQNGAGSILMQQNGAGIGTLTLLNAAPLTFTGSGIGLVYINAPIVGGDPTLGGININYSASALRPFFAAAPSCSPGQIPFRATSL